MTLAKPLLKPALTISKIHGDLVSKKWYGSTLSEHLDGQINQLARRGDGDALKQVIELGFLDPEITKNVTSKRFFSITNFWSKHEALEHRDLLEQWMFLTKKHFPEQAAANFRSLIDCGVSKVVSEADSDTLITNALNACLKAGLTIFDPIKFYAQSVEGAANKSIDKYTNCSILGAAFNRLDERALSELVNFSPEHRSLASIPVVATVYKPLDQKEHNRSLNLIDFCLHARLSPEKMRIAISTLNTQKSSVKVDMGLCIEQYCKTMHALGDSHFRGIALLLKSGADLRLAGKSHSRKTWGNKTLLHKLCELPDMGSEAPGHILMTELDGAVTALVNMRRDDGVPVFDVNSKDAQGNTPLHQAAACAPAISKTLLDAGADANIENDDGVTPRDIANTHGSNDLKVIFSAFEAKEIASEDVTRPKRRFSPSA